MSNQVKENSSSNFIEVQINKDLQEGKYEKVHTRFPPEPNGYLHIGHAKSIILNFTTAQKYNGLCNLRFDDTNPIKEEDEFVHAIKEDVQWLGFNWGDREFFASDFFERMYEYAVKLIETGNAYVDDLTPDEIREYRGTLKEPGKNSPYRDRSVEENLTLFKEMREGVYKDGEKVLRAKIDMSSSNINMRDPILYRILRATHHRTGDDWCIYPMYDFAHPVSDALEGITHSICTLEFEDHRPLYDWVIEKAETPCKPRQIEFARLNLTNTVMSKRYLKRLVDENIVDGWDDPRMPTISGLRRRGITPKAIKDFCDEISVAKANSLVDSAMFEFFIRRDLNEIALRRMAVIDPVKVIITNYPEGKTEGLKAENNPNDENAGTRELLFSREIYIEKEDFMEFPAKKYFRLSPGQEVRLKHAYIIKCEDVKKDKSGNIIEIYCTYDPDTKSGEDTSGKKVKGTLHWVSAADMVEAEVRILDYLINTDDCDDFIQSINKDSLIIKKSLVEKSLLKALPSERFQFLRQGYFSLDEKLSSEGKPVFNRIVSLKDSWRKES
ncbi:MAG: glutamine--tRNA ligase/YqeY domain fusion protein [Eubacteriales bacterium]|nr:glutamine--tRNA ligase/YqeY domain fusion protein [Eubacteriales bacterium]